MIDGENRLKTKMLAISFAQGMALLILHLSITNDFWPSASPQWLIGFYSMAIGVPLSFLLTLTDENQKKLIPIICGYGLLLFATGFYLGLQAYPPDLTRLDNLYFPYLFSMGVATFIFLIYINQYLEDGRFSFRALYRTSWRYFLTGCLSGLFTLIFWGILMLWAALFEQINIEFFKTLFIKEWFYYPVLSVAFGFAITIQRQQQKAIDVIKYIVKALTKYLLLVLGLISLIFLIALPVSGLQSLWDTNMGSALILWLQALLLFFINAVYHDNDNERPYGLYIHRFVAIATATLPLYSAIAFYGLALRIDQYGWTISRSWGILVWLVLALFSVGYCFSVFNKRDDWSELVRWVNIRMGVVMFGIIILINSPLLDFRKISTSSQIARIDSGEVSYEELDVWYFRNELARPGYEALQDLKIEIGDTHPGIVEDIDNAYSETPFTQTEQLGNDAFLAAIKVIPENATLADGLIDEVYDYYQHLGYLRGDLMLLSIDLNDDGTDEYLFLSIDTAYANGQFFIQNGIKWQRREIGDFGFSIEPNTRRLLENGEFEVILPHWKDIRIGDITIRMKPE